MNNVPHMGDIRYSIIGKGRSDKKRLTASLKPLPGATAVKLEIVLY